MDNHASSSRSRPKTPGNTTSTGKKPLSASAEQTLNAWVESNAKDLLEAIANWTRAEPDIRLHPKTVPFYRANERSDKNLRYALGLVYKTYGSLDLRYEGCDTLAEHWVSGWDRGVGSIESVQRIVICVNMGERLPGQAPALDRLAAEIQADSDEEKSEGKDHDSVDSDEEKDQEILDQGITEQELAEIEAEFKEEMSEESDIERADWVDVSTAGVDDGDCMKPHNRSSVVKDAGRMLLDGFRKL